MSVIRVGTSGSIRSRLWQLARSCGAENFGGVSTAFWSLERIIGFIIDNCGGGPCPECDEITFLTPPSLPSVGVANTVYIVDGGVWVYVDGEWVLAHEFTCPQITVETPITLPVAGESNVIYIVDDEVWIWVNDSFVSVYKAPTSLSGVENITYDETTGILTITYNDETPTKTIPLVDIYLKSASVDVADKLVTFLLTNNDEIAVDLSDMFALFYSKEEIDQIAEDNNLVWNIF